MCNGDSGILSWLGSLFGYLLYGCYKVMFSNFGLAIILFTILTRLLMFPMTINQQKSTAKMQRLQPRIKEIQDRYKNDKEKMNNELMALYQKENYNPSSGCLPLLIQFPIFMGLYYALRSPLTHTFHYNKDKINFLIEKLVPERVGDYYNQIYLIDKIKNLDLSGKLNEITTKLYLELDSAAVSFSNLISGSDIASASDAAATSADMAANSIAGVAANMSYADPKVFADVADLAETVNGINEISSSFNFLGLDLLATPTQDKLNIIIVILVFITSVGSMFITNKINGTKNAGGPGCSNPMTMGVGMGLFSAFISYSVPAALGFYWMMGSLISPIQTWIVHKFFNANILNSKAEAQRVARLRIDEAAIIEDTQKRKGIKVFLPVEPTENEKNTTAADNSSSKNNKKKKKSGGNNSSSDYQGKKKN